MPCTAQSSAGGAAMRVADAPRGTSGKHVERGGPPCARWAEAVVARGAEEEGAAAAATTTGGCGAPVLCAITLGRTIAGAYGCGAACGVAIVPSLLLLALKLLAHRLAQGVRDSRSKWYQKKLLRRVAHGVCRLGGMQTLPLSEASRSATASEYLRRVLRFQHMDFEYTVWQMLYLCVNPTRIYRTTTYHSRTKHQWARDDPAFVVVVLYLLLVAVLSWCLAFGASGVELLTTTLYVVCVDFFVRRCVDTCP